MAWGSVHAESVLVFAVVPQFPPDQIYQTWTPVLAEISRRSGLRLELRNYTTIPQFEADLLAGHPDFAYMNPYHAIMAANAANYAPLLRDGVTQLRGVLVVRADSPVTNLSELDGSTIAFPAPNAFGASLYMRALLTEEAGITFQPAYVSTHSNVYRHVVIGQSAAGGGVQRTLNAEPDGIRKNLRVLYETPPAAPHPIAASPRIDDHSRKALADAFYALANDAAGQALLQAVQIAKPVPATLDEYRPLESLGLERFVILDEQSAVSEPAR